MRRRFGPDPLRIHRFRVSVNDEVVDASLTNGDARSVTPKSRSGWFRFR